MESFTEQFRAEYVVEQTIIECKLKESLTNGDVENGPKEACTIKTDASSVDKAEGALASHESENTSLESNAVLSQTPDLDVACPLKPKEDENSVVEETPVAINGSEDTSTFIAKESEHEVKDIPEENAKNGRIPSVENLSLQNKEDSLYPNVIVKTESEKVTESIECKEIKRKGSKQSTPPGGESRKESSNSTYMEKDIETILAEVQATLVAVQGSPFEKSADQLRVAVVGAGPAGLCAARHLIAEGIQAEVYEQCPDIGGTWVYTEETAGGPHIIPLHSSLYHDLWTNLPKETMMYPDFPYREEGYSYLPSEKVLQYLVDYADHFNLHNIIKVKHQVKTVAPLGKGWSVLVEDLSRNLEFVSHFDAVMVCSGPNNIPVYPLIDGIAKFSGKQLHSRDYRRAETYSGKTVLVVGLGPSGLDITYQLEPSAKQVFLSHNMSKEPGIMFPDRVKLKPKVKSLFDKTVTFLDDSTEEVDVIIYCTGYTYNFPFLTEECGLIVDQNVSPLYKHLINIEHPTMCIVGLPKYCPHQYMVDYQIRAFLNILLGRCELPSKEEMMTDLEADRKIRLSEGQRKKDFHKLGKHRTKEYMDDLTKLGKLEEVPPVMYKIFTEAFARAIKDFKGFRKYTYKIVDQENFTVEPTMEKSIQ